MSTHRTMTITVINSGVEEVWTKSDGHLEHGVWMTNGDPQNIPRDATVIIGTTKRTGSKYGVTGDAEFISNIKRGNTLKISWNNPYSNNPGICTAKIEGPDYQAYETDEHFVVDNASCTVVISDIVISDK